MNRDSNWQIAVVGGGIVGLSAAWRLAEKGFAVLVLEAGKLGAEASWAGAGMLTAGSELRQSDPWLPLGIEGAARYPSFVRTLEAQSGVPIDYRPSTAVEIPESEEDAAALEGRAEFQRRHGMAVEIVEGETLAALVPGLAPEYGKALFYPHDAVVDPRDVVAALRVVCTARGVRMVEDAPVSEIVAEADGVSLVAGPERFSAKAAVLAAGAWSSSVPVRFEGKALSLPRVTPVKGHLISYACEPGLLGPVLRQGHTYLLQRQNGILIAGSNEERCGFDRSIDPAQVEAIAQNAARLLPALADMRPADAWVGFRPAARKGTFPVGEWVAPSVCLAYGHYRNGILMAPSTADRIAESIAGRLPQAVPAAR